MTRWEELNERRRAELAHAYTAAVNRSVSLIWLLAVGAVLELIR